MSKPCKLEQAVVLFQEAAINVAIIKTITMLGLDDGTLEFEEAVEEAKVAKRTLLSLIGVELDA